GAIVHAIVGADNLDIAVAPAGNAGVTRIAATAAVIVELARVGEGSFFVAQLANLALHVPGGNAQNLVRANGRIAAQVGIVDLDRAVPAEHSAHAGGDVRASIPRAPVRLHDL